MLLSHRGITTEFQENTLEALEAIKKYQILHKFNGRYFGIEFDVQQLQSGEVVIYHDENLNRLHNDNRLVTSLDVKTAKEFNITFLSDLLDSFKELTFIINIEIKLYTSSNYKKICNSIGEMIIDRKMEKTCIITCYNSDVVMFYLKNYPKIKTHLIIDSRPSILILKDLKKNGMKKIVISKELFKTDPLKYIKYKPIIYCLDPNDEIIKQYPKIDIITDNFEKFIL